MALLKDLIKYDELENMQNEFEVEEEEDELIYELQEVDSMATSTQKVSRKSSKKTKFECLKGIRNDKDLAECFEDSFISTKFNILLTMLEHVMESRPKDKIIIVSQWTRVLNKLSSNLFEKGISYDYLHGKVEMEERHELVQSFNNLDNMSRRVMLLSLACGGGTVVYFFLSPVFFFKLFSENSWSKSYRSQSHVFS
jgi:SNF2 family DNA or RNA helicase